MEQKQVKRILFVVPYPYDAAPSQRFRFEQYIPLLRNAGYSVKFASFIDLSTWHLLYKPGKTYQKILGILRGLLGRMALMFTLGGYDFVFIHREAAPLGPPVFEWMMAKCFRKKLIYDFDDAIWLPNTSKENRIVARMKWHSKAACICRYAWKVSAGNTFLKAYAEKFNRNVVLNPTTIDTEHMHVPCFKNTSVSTKGRITIGWTGTHSTMPYLQLIEPVLKQLETQYAIHFVVISDASPDLNISNFTFIEWNKTTEHTDLCKIDIGIMPLPDNDWARGKCGFKALQFMALEIPVVASAIGANKQIISHGFDGLLVPDNRLRAWREAIESLIDDQHLYRKIAKNGREKVKKNFSVSANFPVYRDQLFQMEG